MSTHIICLHEVICNYTLFSEAMLKMYRQQRPWQQWVFALHLWNRGVIFTKTEPALVAESHARPTGGGRGIDPCLIPQHYFGEIDREIVSTVILSLPLIQKGQLSVSGERICTSTG